MYLQECVVARRVRTDQRWDAGFGAGAGKPGSNVSKGVALARRRPAVTSGRPKGGITKLASRRTVATGGALRFDGGML
jgi:hypothetical protein